MKEILNRIEIFNCSKCWNAFSWQTVSRHENLFKIFLFIDKFPMFAIRFQIWPISSFPQKLLLSTSDFGVIFSMESQLIDNVTSMQIVNCTYIAQLGNSAIIWSTHSENHTTIQTAIMLVNFEMVLPCHTQPRMSKTPFINDNARNGSDGVQKYWTKQMENMFVQFEVNASHSICNIGMQKHFVQKHHKDYPNDKQVANVNHKMQCLQTMYTVIQETSLKAEQIYLYKITQNSYTSFS